MPQRTYSADQRLNSYHEMLHNIYGPSQNYAKNKFEVLSHLSEVCGIASKYIFKKNDVERATKFVPKIFGWACALVKSINPQESDVERIILQKFPGVCSYCLGQPCACWNTEKPTLDAEALRREFYNRASGIRRGVDDFELMFREIYENSWMGGDGRPIGRIYLRLMEELAEVSEAVRFYHLYPQNFENEIADFFAWWFALAFALKAERGERAQPTSALLWNSYPGHCLDCQSTPCFCQQGPVRELMSKPSPGHIHEMDQLTSLRNQGSYNQDIENIRSGTLTFPVPMACVRIDADKFKNINDTYGHPAGDAALKHVASTLRAKSNVRHRLYRISGDEFGVLMPDSSEEEASGLMHRVLRTLREIPVRWIGPDGAAIEFHISLSVGVAQCDSHADVEATFSKADEAAYWSKNAGRDRVSRYSLGEPSD